MEKIKDILKITRTKGLYRWSVNTRRSNLIGFERSEKLSQEIDNWETHKLFANKYGLMFNYPEDFLSIYILISLLKNFRILFHPDKQETNSSIDKLNLNYNNVGWLYTEEIHYDNEYNYNVYTKEFYKVGFQDFTDNRGLLKIVWDLAFKNNSNSRMYELTNSYQIHQAVICGGNGDVAKCPNYYGIKSVVQKQAIIDILSSQEEPTLLQILENCEFFIADYKGEDLGYARQFNLYTNKEKVTDILNKVVDNFSNFQTEIKELNLAAENLEEYTLKLDQLEKRYGC